MSSSDPRTDFPILDREIDGQPLVYLDNAATTQKPRAVIERLATFFEGENANIHRGVHFLSMGATDSYDRARAKVAGFLGAAPAEIVFTRGTTESINLVARSFGGTVLEPGDEILITDLEHHANIVPWQMIAAERGARIVVAPIDDAGDLDLDAWRELLGERTRIAAFTHASNALGTINPVREMVELARCRDVVTVVDGAQAVAHGPVDVAELDCDFYAFSSHKLFGPDGVGVLFGKSGLLREMPPYQGGGDMIERVRIEGTTYRLPPERFEAGTPNISGAIGLGVAIDYLESVGWDTIQKLETEISAQAESALTAVPGIEADWNPGPACSRFFPSNSRGFIRMTSGRSSTPSGWRCAPATTAPNPSWTGSESTAPPAPPSPFTTTGMTSSASSPGWKKPAPSLRRGPDRAIVPSRQSMDDHLSDLYQDIILGHCQRPRNAEKPDPFDASADGYNPALRGRVDRPFAA